MLRTGNLPSRKSVTAKSVQDEYRLRPKCLVNLEHVSSRQYKNTNDRKKSDFAGKYDGVIDVAAAG